MSPKLVVLGLDGFRWDYAFSDKTKTPYFDRMAKEGVHAKHGIKTTFVSSTYPSYWTISTGLHPENHGLIDNVFYDPEYQETFPGPGGLEDAKWWAGEPVWITAKKQGKKVALYDWMAHWITFDGLRPDLALYQEEGKEWATECPEGEPSRRVDTCVKWLVEEDSDLVMIYLGQPDLEAHITGAFSPTVIQWVERLDTFLGQLMSALSDNKMLDETNIVTFADHGMVDAFDSPLVALEDYIDIQNDLISITQVGPMAGIIPKPEKLLEVYEQLKRKAPHVRVFLKEDIPEEFHFKNNKRVAPIVVLADEGYLIRKTSADTWVRGQHGYDSNFPDMNPFFLARGPDFKANFDSPVFDTVHLYSMMCHLLRIDAAPNDGSLDAVRYMFTQTE